jgi:hypothetical protein
MNLQQLREKYPAYKDVEDDKLADGLYNKFYSSMDRDDFNQQIGYTPASIAEQVGDYAKGVGLSFSQGATAGYDDDLADVMGLDGQAMREERKQFAETNPKSAFVADMIGSVVSPANKVMLPFKIAKGLTKGSRALRASGAGGSIGAIQSSGRAEGDVGQKMEAGLMGGVGGVLTGGLMQRGIDTNAVQNVIRKVTTKTAPLTKAERKIAKDIEEIGGGDINKGIKTVQTELQEGGKNTILADTGASLAGRTKQAADASPSARLKVKEFVEGRFAGRRKELEDVPNVISSKKYYDNLDDLNADQSGVAGPLYRKAFEPISDDSGKVLVQWDDELQSLFENKTIQKALAKGVKDIEDEAFNKGVSPQLNELAIESIGETGEIIFKSVPNLRTMDAAKRGLDRIIYGDKNRNPLTGKLSDEIEGFGSTRNMMGLRKRLVNKLDEVTTNEDGVSFYKQARAAYAGPAKAKDAMITGRNFVKGDEEQGKRIFDRLNDSEQEAFLVGVRQQIKTMLTQDRVSALNKFADKKDDLWARLKNVLPPEKYSAFQKQINAQIKKSRTENIIRPKDKSGVASKQDDMSLYKELQQGLRGQNPFAVATIPAGRAMKAFSDIKNKKMLDEIAEILTNPDPQAQTALLNKIKEQNPLIGERIAELLIKGSQPAMSRVTLPVPQNRE